MNYKSFCARLLFLVCILILGRSAVVNAQSKAVASDDQLKVLLGHKVLLHNDRDGFMSVSRIVYSPDGKHFVVIGCGFECTDNIGFLFRADGTRKRIKHNSLSGWVNQNFLFQDAPAAQGGELETISGIEWVLREWKSDEPAPASPAVTLNFENGKFTGRSGCNRYSSPVTAGSTPGAIKVGPTVSTRMACPESVMAIEDRFLRQLEAVTKFELPSGQLALTYELGRRRGGGVMLFEKK